MDEKSVGAENESLACISGRDSNIFNNCSVTIIPGEQKKRSKFLPVYWIVAGFVVWGALVVHVLATAHADIEVYIDHGSRYIEQKKGRWGGS